MSKRFKRWMRDWLMSDDVLEKEPARRHRPIGLNSVSTMSPNDPDRPFDHNMTVHITTAQGGVILTFNKYDHAKDRNQQTVYVIHSDEQMTDNIAQTISMELLKR